MRQLVALLALAATAACADFAGPDFEACAVAKQETVAVYGTPTLEYRTTMYAVPEGHAVWATDYWNYGDTLFVSFALQSPCDVTEIRR